MTKINENPFIRLVINAGIVFATLLIIFCVNGDPVWEAFRRSLFASGLVLYSDRTISSAALGRIDNGGLSFRNPYFWIEQYFTILYMVCALGFIFQITEFGEYSIYLGTVLLGHVLVSRYWPRSEAIQKQRDYYRLDKITLPKLYLIWPIISMGILFAFFYKVAVNSVAIEVAIAWAAFAGFLVPYVEIRKFIYRIPHAVGGAMIMTLQYLYF